MQQIRSGLNERTSTERSRGDKQNHGDWDR